jgi:RNA polymerase sigma-70 factor (ECF subfamily)
MDTDLVVRAQQGDEVAFTSLAMSVAHRLHAVAHRILRDTELAEDATQQALLTVWRDLPQLRDPARFDAWSYRLLVRACYAEARRTRRWTPNLRLLQAGDPTAGEGLSVVVDRDQLERAFRRLSIDHRAVVVLHHYLDLPLSEVAEVLRVSEGTVRSRLHYAMRGLRGARRRCQTRGTGGYAVTTERDTTRVVRSWLDDGVTALPDRVLRAVLEQVSVTPQRRPWWPAWRPLSPSNAVRIALVAAAAAVVAIFGINVLQLSRGMGGPSTAGSPSLSASPSEQVGIVGLPPEGADLSDSASGELVLQYDGNLSGPASEIWVFADGRLIWNRYRYVPADASAAFIGLVEQRLTASGIEFLRSEVISTGLFENDLALAREGDGPFLGIQVRNGDRPVRVTWAVRENWRVGQDAPVPTREQEMALRDLSALLTDPASWPASAWEDQTIRAYVPSRFSVCFRGIPQPIEPARIQELLPEPAQLLLRAGDQTQEERVPSNGDCSRVTTHDARALAQILEGAGIEQEAPDKGAFWVRYLLPNQPDLGNTVWISFGPVLPSGEATWLGPG